MTALDTPLAKARRRDVELRRQRVHQTLADMHVDGSPVSVSANVHRSFVRRHPDLRAAVLSAAAGTITDPSPAATAPCWPRTPTCTSRTGASPSTSAIWKTACRNYSGSKPSTAADSAPRPAPRRCRPNSTHNTRPVSTSNGDWKNVTRKLAAARETNRRLMNQLNRTLNHRLGASTARPSDPAARR